jgi:hypothetical protein
MTFSGRGQLTSGLFYVALIININRYAVALVYDAAGADKEPINALPRFFIKRVYVVFCATAIELHTYLLLMLSSNGYGARRQAVGA